MYIAATTALTNKKFLRHVTAHNNNINNKPSDHSFLIDRASKNEKKIKHNYQEYLYDTFITYIYIYRYIFSLFE